MTLDDAQVHVQPVRPLPAKVRRVAGVIEAERPSDPHPIKVLLRSLGCVVGRYVWVPVAPKSSLSSDRHGTHLTVGQNVHADTLFRVAV